MEERIQAEIKKIHGTRKVFAILSIFITIISMVLIHSVIKDISSDFSEDFVGIIISWGMSAMFAYIMCGGFLPGIAHTNDILAKTRGILVIPVIGLVIYIWLMLVLATCTGWAFLIIDIVKILQKKSLVSDNEAAKIRVKYMMQTPMGE